MAAAQLYLIKKRGCAEEIGPVTIDQLRDLLRKGEVSGDDGIRGANQPPSTNWTRIREAQLAARRHRSDSAAVRDEASRSLDTPDNSPARTAAVPAASATVIADDAWRLKGWLSVTLGALALLLTLLNTCWLLLANASAREPKSQPSNPTERMPLAEATPAPAASSPATDENPPLIGEVLRRLEAMDTRLSRIDQRVEVQSSPDLLCQAIQSGFLECRVAEVDFRFIYIPAGRFRFGYPAEDQNRVVKATGNPNSFLNASPECSVTVARGFFMLDREITVQQWNSCALDVTSKAIASPAGQEPLPPNSPKQNISWLDAQSFCLTLKTAVPLLCAEGCEVRLPTEIEWEYAGRGGLGLTYPWVTHGSSTDRFLGFARGVATAPVPVDVLSNKDVAWRGQFDLAGNLSEWCLDQYEQSLHEALAARHVQGTLTYDPADNALVKAALAGKEGDGNPSRTLRGGSIVDGPEACELPMRRFLPQNKGAEHIGFRPVIIIRKTAHATVEEQQ